jgi:hypothetical protein
MAGHDPELGKMMNDSPVWLELEPRPEQVKCGKGEERVEIVYEEIGKGKLFATSSTPGQSGEFKISGLPGKELS